MSLEYVVYLDSSMPPRELEQQLQRSRTYEMAGGTDHNRRGDPPVDRGPVSLLDESTQRMIKDSYDFRPTVGVVYGLDKSAPPADRERGTLAAIADLLRQNSGDAYVGFAGLRTALVRRGGRVSVNQDWLGSRPWLRPDVYAMFGSDSTIVFVPEPE